MAFHEVTVIEAWLDDQLLPRYDFPIRPLRSISAGLGRSRTDKP